MCYSIGALNIFESLYDIKAVTMHIFQPRGENIQRWTISVEELKEWAECELKPKAEMALKGEGDYHTGEWCQFCKAAVRCRTRAEEKLRLAQEEFKMPPLLIDPEIEEVLTILSDLTKWADGILAYTTDAAVNHGKEWSGFKIVEGKSVRKYKDEGLVTQAVKDHSFHNIYRHSLITMTEMQKMMGKKQFESILGNLIVKPKGNPTLVPVTDKRPAMNVANAINEFKQKD